MQNSPGLEQAGMDFAIARSKSDGNLASLGLEAPNQGDPPESPKKGDDREADSELSPFTPMDSSTIATDSSRASSTSRPTTNSGPPTPTSAKSFAKRHISFNKFVEQRISINVPEGPVGSKSDVSAGDIDRENEATSWQAEDGDGDNEDEVGEGGGVWFRAPSIRKKAKKVAEKRRNYSEEREMEEARGRSQSKTIAWYSPTTLKNIDSWGTGGKNPIVVHQERTIINRTGGSLTNSSNLDGLVDERYQDWESGQSTPTLSVRIDQAYAGSSTFAPSSTYSLNTSRASRRPSSPSKSSVKTHSSPSQSAHSGSYPHPNVMNPNLRTRIVPAGSPSHRSGSSNSSPRSKFSDPADYDSDLSFSDDELMPMPTIASTLRAVVRTSIALGMPVSSTVAPRHGAVGRAKGKGRVSKSIDQGEASLDGRGRSSSRSSSEERSPSRTSSSDRRSNVGLGLGLVRSDSQDSLVTLRGERGTRMEKDLFQQVSISTISTTDSSPSSSSGPLASTSTSTRYSASTTTPYYFSEDDDIGFGYYDSADDESSEFSILTRGKEVVGTVRDLLGAFKQGIWG